MVALQNNLPLATRRGEQAQTGRRVAYLDNLRIYLTLLVILHHAAIAYGGAGDWPVKDPAVDRASQILFSIFNAINQAYFMSAFFLLAGYFTPPALASKGTKQFLLDRLLRLGIPLLIYSTLMVNINKYLLDVYYRGVPYQPFFGYNAGHLWFLQALLLFALLYVGFCVVTPQQVMAAAERRNFPSTACLVGWIGLLAGVTFVVRLAFPVGKWALEVQPGHFVHYAVAFGTGILAYRHDWFNQLPAPQARRWGSSALIAIPLFVPLVALAGVLEEGANVAKLLGGWHWQALAFALWESWLLVAVTIWLLYFFRTKLNGTGEWTRTVAANLYTVYIIHQTILIALNIALLAVPIPTPVKFALAALLTIFIGFGVSGQLRKLPLAKRVLG